MIDLSLQETMISTEFRVSVNRLAIAESEYTKKIRKYIRSNNKIYFQGEEYEGF